MKRPEPSLSRAEKYLMACHKEGQALAQAGVPVAQIQEGFSKSILAYVKEHGLVQDERELPTWQFRTCPRCTDGWVATTRQHRGQIVEAHRRCECKATAPQADYKQRAADKIASGWNR